MRKLIRKASFASLMLFVTTIGNVHAAEDGLKGIKESNVCNLISSMGNVFQAMRALAFLGAAFIIAGWAWGYISSGKVELKDVKEKGIGMLVGFGLLFSIAILMTFLDSSCKDSFGTWK